MDTVLQEFSYLETLVSYLFCISLILLLIVPFLVERLMKTPKKAAPVLIFGFLAVLCIFFQFNLLSDWESRHQVAVLEQMGSIPEGKQGSLSFLKQKAKDGTPLLIVSWDYDALPWHLAIPYRVASILPPHGPSGAYVYAIYQDGAGNVHYRKPFQTLPSVTNE